MNGIGFIADIWLKEALRDGLIPTGRAYIAATVIADAADRDGRWCFLLQSTLVHRAGRTLSHSTAKRALNDLVRVGLLRKLPRAQLPAFFAADIAARRRRADNLPDVLELLIPASAFTRHGPAVLEEINAVRARLGEEPITPANRPDPPASRTGGHGEPPRRATVDPRDRSDRPANPSPGDPSPDEPDPDPIRRRVTTGRPAPAASARVPRPRTSPDPAPEPESSPPPAWAGELLARVPDAALLRPGRDRRRLAARLGELAAAGVGRDELRRALEGWEHTRSPYAALTARLASPEAVRAWNARAFLRALPPPRQAEDAFAHRPRFAVDSRGRATGTCPAHPSLRNTPGGTCAACGSLCRTHPGEVVHPPGNTGGGSGVLQRLFGPPDIDEQFTAPKCDSERCNGDRSSPRYRTVVRLAPDDRSITAVPCPTCGHRIRPPAHAA
ncbi:hypothetical protein [Nocardiopsis dassonvillei]|uniref:hypothetical protein n=1 Tax=Nocardiopsis dassonvillei TaxID=2014 RepID=UPI003F54D8E2